MERVRLKDIKLPFTIHTSRALTKISQKVNENVKTYMLVEILKKVNKREYLCRRLTLTASDEGPNLEEEEFTAKSDFVKTMYERPQDKSSTFKYGEFTNKARRKI